MNVLLPLLVNFAFKYVSQKIQIQDWWELNWTQQPWTYNISFVGAKTNALEQCFSTAGSRLGTGPWRQLHQAARGSPGKSF